MDKQNNDKLEQRLNAWCSGEGIDFFNDEAKEAYQKRTKRIADVIQLKIPDRVPIVPSFGMFPAIDNGYTCEEVTFNYEKAHKAWMKTLHDFQPDAFNGSSYALSGRVLELLDYKQLKLPGRHISPKHVHQFVENEYVKAEEFYDHFIDDPADFMMRVYLPRVCGALKAFEKARPVYELFGYYISILGNIGIFGTEEVEEALNALIEAGKEAIKWGKHLSKETKEIRGLGYPSMAGGGSAAPYDIIGDWFRGTQGVMVDMYRYPEKLLKAMDILVAILIKMGVDQSIKSGNPIVELMLHKGPEGFMSLEHYKTFYWPTLRKVMLGLIEAGCVPMPLFEGDYTSRLEVISDIPKGKAIYWFETVDIYKAKEILNGVVCFKGNVPITTLCIGTPQDVKAYVKELIDVVGKDGGLMVDCGAWFDEAKHENVKAMVDFTKEYGVYR